MRNAGKRPQYNLSINILRLFISEKELTDLLDRYMEAKRKKYAAFFEAGIK
jgi:hypothetical protein